MEKMALVQMLVLFIFAATAAAENSEWHLNNLAEFGKEKMTQLHFFFHDIVQGKNPSAVKVAEAAMTKASPTGFGVLMMADDPLTEGPEPTSKLVGQAQGMYGSAGQQELGLIMAMSFCFSHGLYKDSTLSIIGRNSAMHPIREMPIVGGTGVFRFARGIALAKTYQFNATTGDAIVEYNVTAIHYDATLRDRV